MNTSLMNLRLLLPFQVLIEQNDVSRIVAETYEGSFGILPQRLDCIATLCPGILIYEHNEGGETYVAIDEGVLIKKDKQVLISVHNAVVGKDLEQLSETVRREFLTFNEEEQNARTVLSKLESAFVRRFVEIQHA